MHPSLVDNPLQELEFIFSDAGVPNYGEFEEKFSAREELKKKIKSIATHTEALLFIEGNNHTCGNGHENPKNLLLARHCLLKTGNWNCGHQDMALVAPFCEFLLWHFMHDYRGSRRSTYQEQAVIQIIADIRKYADLKKRFDRYLYYKYTSEPPTDAIRPTIEGVFTEEIIGFREPSQELSEEIRHWSGMAQKIVFLPMITQIVSRVKKKTNQLGVWEKCSFSRDPILDKSKKILRKLIREKQFSTEIFGRLTTV